MSTPLDSKHSEKKNAASAETGAHASWLRMGAVAAVSALAGGIAAAWFYRKTLTQLRSAESIQQDSNFRTLEDSEDDI